MRIGDVLVVSDGDLDGHTSDLFGSNVDQIGVFSVESLSGSDLGNALTVSDRESGSGGVQLSRRGQRGGSSARVRPSDENGRIGGVVVIFHFEGVFDGGFQSDRTLVRGRTLVSPGVDDEDVIDPHSNTVVDGGVEGPGSGHSGLDQTLPSDGELVGGNAGDGRTPSPVEPNGGIGLSFHQSSEIGSGVISGLESLTGTAAVVNATGRGNGGISTGGNGSSRGSGSVGTSGGGGNRGSGNGGSRGNLGDGGVGNRGEISRGNVSSLSVAQVGGDDGTEGASVSALGHIVDSVRLDHLGGGLGVQVVDVNSGVGVGVDFGHQDLAIFGRQALLSVVVEKVVKSGSVKENFSGVFDVEAEGGSASSSVGAVQNGILEVAIGRERSWERGNRLVIRSFGLDHSHPNVLSVDDGVLVKDIVLEGSSVEPNGSVGGFDQKSSSGIDGDLGR